MITAYIAITIILVAFLISQSLNKKQKISSKGICSICDEVFEESLIIEEDGLSFCKNHHFQYKESTWVIIQSCECSPENEQESVELYLLKKTNYSKGILGFLRSSYKEIDGKIITTLDYYQKKSPAK